MAREPDSKRRNGYIKKIYSAYFQSDQRHIQFSKDSPLGSCSSEDMPGNRYDYEKLKYEVEFI